MSEITGGAPQNKVIQATDQDMKEIQSLINSGVGQRDLDSKSENALLGYLKSKSNRASVYKQWRDSVDYLMTSREPSVVRARERAISSMRQKFLTPGDVHTDRLASELSIMYANDMFIGEMLAPPVLVNSQSNVYPVYDRRDITAIPDDTLSSYGSPNMLTMNTSTASYLCKWYGYSLPVSADTVANQDAPYDVLLDSTEIILETEALKREIRIKDVVGVSGSYGSNTSAPTVTWNDPSGGTPIADIQAADAALWNGRGPSKKRMFSSLTVAHVLMRHPEILALFQYNGSSPGLATPSMIAQFLNADDYVVGAARYDSAKEGQASASYARVWPDVFGLIRVAERPTLRMAAFASTFRWNANVPGMNQGMLTQQWYKPEDGGAGVYYAKHSTCEDHKVVAVDTGYLLTSVLT